jgi:hypothetical protein
VLDGGQNAARGFRYQYRRTLEALIEALDKPAVAAVGVEGSTVSSGAEVVDFDVEGHDGRCLLAAQVKSKTAGATMSAAEAFRVLARLAREVDAEQYEVLTNANPGPGATALATTLATVSNAESLHRALTGILRPAERRTAELQWLIDNHPDRLTRMRLSFDDRDDNEVADDLREALRHHRNKARQGLGDAAAGLLSGYLIDQIFDKAANRTRCRYPIDEFRAQLLIDSGQLARVLGGRDSGIMAGSMPAIPDIARPELLQRIVSSFSSASRSGVQRVALVGASGIGKTSLAASYVADRADAYQLIMWADASSETSLLESFRIVLAALRDDPSLAGYAGTVVQLRGEVHHELSRLAGRWVMIFDNARGPREVEAWIPSVGNGDVLISSLDAAAGYGSATVIEVSRMRLGEAVALLAARLGATDPEGSPELANLAEQLGYWPLALELGAGYLRSCGIGLDGVDDYLRRLKVRSLADVTALPPAYPRTLAAALSLCLEDLADRLRFRRSADAPRLSIDMLRMAAYLSARQIPVHLIAVAVVADDADDSQHLGPILVDPSVFNVLEEVRDLRRYSLVSRDHELPSGEESEPDVRYTITVNSVVQDLLRAELDRHPQTPVALDRLAFHLNRWLISSMDLGFLPRAFLMSTHANTLAEHLRRLRIFSDRIGVMWGNLAGAYRAQGDLARAAELLLEEIHHLEQIDRRDEGLLAQARLALADVLLDRDAHAKDSAEPAAATNLAQVLAYVQGIADQYPSLAVRLAYHASSTLGRPGAAELGDARLTKLAAAFRQVLDTLPPTPFSEAMDGVNRAAHLMTDEKPAAAEQVLRTVLASNVILGATELEARRLLYEAVVHQQRWDQATEEFGVLRAMFGDAPLHLSVVSDIVHNTGLTCALHVVLQQAPEAAHVLAELLDWPAARAATAVAEGGRRDRLRLLAAIGCLGQREYPQAEAILHELDTATFEGNGAAAWSTLQRFARLALLQEANLLDLSGHVSERRRQHR